MVPPAGTQSRGVTQTTLDFVGKRNSENDVSPGGTVASATASTAAILSEGCAGSFARYVSLKSR